MINKTNLDELLKNEHFVISGHGGNSMYPLIKLDDQLLIMELNKDPELYDIVAYKSKDKYILHRLIGIKDDCYIIRGDNCLNNEIIKKDRIIAYLDTIYRGDVEIKITDSLNKKYYLLSCLSLPFRRGLVKLKSFIKRLIKYE